MVFMLKGYTVNRKNKVPSIQITEQLLQSSSAIKKKKRSLEDVKSWKTVGIYRDGYQRKLLQSG